jgi:hypothetical protein
LFFLSKIVELFCFAMLYAKYNNTGVTKAITKKLTVKINAMTK